MRVLLTGRELDDIAPLFKRSSFKIVDESPDVIVTHGGDGSLLSAERAYPGVPKCPIRDQRSASLCPRHSHEKIVEALSEGTLKTSRLMKLRGASGDKEVKGINDVFVHNVERVSALRYRVWIDDELYATEIVGDGVGVSTVHGSTAYYRSITHSVFRTGIGLAFSNSKQAINHLVLPKESVITIRVVRGPGLLVGDNQNENIVVREGADIAISKTDEVAIIHGLDVFMCPECRELRHGMWRERNA